MSQGRAASRLKNLMLPIFCAADPLKSTDPRELPADSCMDAQACPTLEPPQSGFLYSSTCDELKCRASVSLRPWQLVIIGGMTEITRILSAMDEGDPHAAEQLLPLVYEELRKLAAQKLAQEKPGQTLQATALVHEAYLRLVGA